MGWLERARAGGGGGGAHEADHPGSGDCGDGTGAVGGAGGNRFGGGGGGALLLYATGGIGIGGSITADGGDGGQGSTSAPHGAGGGGGSGGAILLQSATVSVNGSLSARGGARGTSTVGVVEEAAVSGHIMATARKTSLPKAPSAGIGRYQQTRLLVVISTRGDVPQGQTPSSAPK